MVLYYVLIYENAHTWKLMTWFVTLTCDLLFVCVPLFLMRKLLLWVILYVCVSICVCFARRQLSTFVRFCVRFCNIQNLCVVRVCFMFMKRINVWTKQQQEEYARRSASVRVTVAHKHSLLSQPDKNSVIKMNIEHESCSISDYHWE